MVGEIHRRFDLTPAVPNDRDLRGNIIAFLDPITLAAQHFVVFVDKGREEGVKDGNRFLMVEKVDQQHPNSEVETLGAAPPRLSQA